MPVLLTTPDTTARRSATAEPAALIVAEPERALPPPEQRLPRLNDRELELFTRNLQTQISAGVPLVRALQLQAQGEQDAIAEASAELANRIESGASLGEALDAHPYAFPSTYRNLARAGEVSGQLDSMLEELASFLAWRTDVKKTLRQASTYPTLVIVATFALVLFILGFVFPKFTELFLKMGDGLPAHVRVLMSTGDFIAAQWMWIVAGAIGSVTALVMFARSAAGRAQVYAVLCRLPVFGKIFNDIDLAMLMRNLALLERAGIPLIRALELSIAVVESRTLGESVQEIADDLRSGDTFSHAIEKTEALPPMVLNLVHVGEEAGRLPDILDRLGKHYSNESKESTQRALAFLEPAVTLVLGLFVAGIAVTVISTLYEAIRASGR